MNTPRDIVITGLQSWHMALGGNIVNMATEFSKENRVLFINYAVDRFTLLRQPSNPAVIRYKECKKSPALALEQLSDNLWVYNPVNLLESVSQIRNRTLFNQVNEVNMKRFGREVNKLLKTLHFKDILLFTDSDFYRSFFLKEILSPWLFVYYIRDNMIATDFFRYHGARMEEAMIRKADLVVANSEYLASYARQFNPYSWFVGQGCDPDLFNPDTVTGIPSDIKPIRQAYTHIVGYVGALRSIRIDRLLIEHLALAMPDVAFVLIGPEDEAFSSSSLHDMPNVFFLGSKPGSELPAYIQVFDVAINPQVYNEVTRGNYPRKIDEYLAMGKPVVATRTEAMEMFRESCFLGGTPEEYEKLIREAIATDSPEAVEKRKSVGRSHSWKNNIRNIYHCIETYLNDVTERKDQFELKA